MYVYIYVYMYMYIYTTHVFWCQTALLFHLTMGQLAPRIHSCLVRCPWANYVPVILCPDFPIFFFFFFWGGGGGEDRQTGKGWGFDWQGLPSGASFVSTCTTCLRVKMFYCGLESYKQTNHMLAMTIMLLITILTTVFLLSVLKS